MADPVLQSLFYQIVATVYFVLFFVSLLLNGAAILTFTRDKTLRVPQNYLLISMAVSDLLTTCLSTLVGAYANYQRWWTLSHQVCQMFAFIATCCGLASIWHHAALALQRLVSFKFTLSCNVNRRNVLVVIVFCWVVPVVYSSLPLFGWSSFGPEPGFVGCSVTWYSNDLNDYSYVMTMFVLFFFVPLVIMLTCYVRVHLEMKSITQKAAVTWGHLSVQFEDTIRAKQRNVKMSIAMSSAFIIAWTPYALVSLYIAFGGKTNPLAVVIPALFAKLSSCYNVIIFIFIYRKFRQTFYHEVICRIRKQSSEIANYARGRIHRIQVTLSNKPETV